MRLMRGPVARIAGSAVSWLLFTFSFTLLYLTSAVVLGLGGFCARGGPYVIETPCPDAVVVFAPLSIFGGLIAAAIGLLFARGFGTPLVIWAWPVLFVGLGIAFLLASSMPGGIANLVVAVVFVVMGLAPLVIVLRTGLRDLLVGTTNAQDRPFRDVRAREPIFRIGGSTGQAGAMPATVGDWMRALVVSVPAIVAGIWLGQLAFAAVASSG